GKAAGLDHGRATQHCRQPHHLPPGHGAHRFRTPCSWEFDEWCVPVMKQHLDRQENAPYLPRRLASIWVWRQAAEEREDTRRKWLAQMQRPRKSQLLRVSKSTTQQPRTCGPGPRQWFSIARESQPDFSRLSARLGRRSKDRSW